MEKKFRVLRIVGTVYKVLAWLVLAVGVLGGCLTLAGGFVGGASPRSELGPVAGLLGGAFGGLVLIFITFVYFLFLYAFGDMIYLLLALEENTRLTAERLKETAKA